ncbi:putative urea ABC transporter substrate-binding protein [Iodidimonas sp. SYSU 1G8]|uniref:putative urea ABC transporter substrate-binding protein n=1 Tax=Iodidimonas sp. SYSU 1G8 TaxID=3133967 RepID=UPI0031FECA06
MTRWSFRWTPTFLVALIAMTLSAAFVPAKAQTKKNFTVAWSIYTGYMPWAYAEQSGILKKWGDKYGISVKAVQMNDYVESINQYTAGQFDAVVGTNMDALTIPAAGGVDTTALLIGDYSNGNDAIILKGKGKSLKDIKGQTVSLVQFSVSHYMLARALGTVGLKDSDVELQNISDADFVAAFQTGGVDAIVAWNPGLMQIQQNKDISVVFLSTQIPAELQDILMVNTATLRANPALGKALTGAWFEVMAIMGKQDAQGIKARQFMAEASGTTLAEFDAQVKTTYFYYEPADGAAFVASPEMMAIMDRVRGFCFANNLMGSNVKSKDAIGIAFPGGKVLGDKANIKLRFDDSYMRMAAAGKL